MTPVARKFKIPSYCFWFWKKKLKILSLLKKKIKNFWIHQFIINPGFFSIICYHINCFFWETMNLFFRTNYEFFFFNESKIVPYNIFLLLKYLVLLLYNNISNKKLENRERSWGFFVKGKVCWISSSLSINLRLPRVYIDKSLLII